MSANQLWDSVSGCRQVGLCRGAAERCGVTRKTVGRVVNRAEAAQQQAARRRNYESIRLLVATEVEDRKGQVQGKAAAARGEGCGLSGLGP